jgi:hypothetical protein
MAGRDLRASAAEFEALRRECDAARVEFERLRTHGRNDPAAHRALVARLRHLREVIAGWRQRHLQVVFQPAATRPVSKHAPLEDGPVEDGAADGRREAPV